MYFFFFRYVSSLGLCGNTAGSGRELTLGEFSLPTSLMLQRQRPLGFILLLFFVALGSFAEALGSCRERFCSLKTAWPLGPKQKEPPVVSQHGNGCHKLDGCLSGHKLGHQFLEKTKWKNLHCGWRAFCIRPVRDTVRNRFTTARLRKERHVHQIWPIIALHV